MKTGKRILSVVLVVLMLLTAAPLAGFVGLEIAPKAGALAATGQCGENVFWSYNSSTGALTISGTGATSDYIVDESPFYNHSEIQSLTICYGVTCVGRGLFSYCSRLKEVTIANSVTCIGVHAFSFCNSLISVTIPDSVTIIDDHSFQGCMNLTNILFGKNVTSIGSGAFSICDSLSTVNIPDNVTIIEDDAFMYCSNLTKVNISESVTTIGGRAFYCCSSLKDVAIPSSVTHIGTGAFANCDSLRGITVDENNSVYSSSIDGVLFNKNQTTIVCFTKGNPCGSYTIPDSVMCIGDSAFFYCSNLNSIKIPDSVTTINSRAFYNCKGLMSVTIPQGVNNISSNSFYGCYNLTCITIAEGVIEIGDYAFFRCNNLNSVYYSGSETQWNAISIGANNGSLTSATIHYGEVFEEPEPDWVEIDSGFEPSIDGNGFYHGAPDNEESGFYGYYDNFLTLPKYYRYLLHNAQWGNKTIALVLLHRKNGAWCFGIAATMGLLFEKTISLDDLTDRKDIKNYYDLGKPCNDELFLNNINYYYLLQSVAPGLCDRTAANAQTIRRDVFEGLSNPFFNFNSSSYQHFFKELIAFLATGHVAVLCNQGHAMLATGVRYDNANKEYCIQVYDENTATPLAPGKFSSIIVSTDYSSFTVFDEEGSIIESETNYNEFTFFDMSKLEKYIVKKDYPSFPSVSQSFQITYPVLTMQNNMRVVASSGDAVFNLEYKDGHLSGNMPVYSFNYRMDGEANQDYINVEIPKYDSYTIISGSEKTDFMLCNDNQVYALSANDVDCVTVNTDTGINIVGDSFSFDAFVSTDKEVAEDQNGLIFVSGNANSNIHIGKNYDSIQLSSEQQIDNVKGTTYLGLISEEKDYGTVDSLQIKAEKETNHQVDEFETISHPTCTRAGLKKGFCLKCFQEVKEDISPLGHAYVNHNAKAPTCTEKGWDAYQTCSRCNYTTYKEKAALGHIDKNNDGKCDRCKDQMTGEGVCPYCGKVHKSFFDKITGFFHKIIYKLTHLFKKEPVATTDAKK